MSAFRTRALLAALLLTLAAASYRVADAAEPTPAKDSSLSLVPADASFYSAGLRWKEQVDLFYNSRAYKALRSLPTVKKAYDDVMKDAKKEGGPLKQFEAFSKSDLGKDVIQIATEAVSDEMFVFGGAGWSDFIKVMTSINQAQTVGTYGALFTGTDPNTGQGRAILRALTKNRDKLKLPGFVLGFRVATPDKADKLIDKLGKIAVAFGPVAVKELEDRIHTKKIAGGKFVTVELEGSQIPWEMVPFADLEEKKGEFDDLVATLKKAKFTAALGVTGNHILLSIGEDTKDLEAFAGKGKKLIDHEGMKVVRDLGAKRFTSLGYISKAFLDAAGGSYATQYADTIKGLKDALKGADLKEERKKAIAKEMDDLADKLQKAPKAQFGESVGYSYLTDFGFEAYSHDRTIPLGMDKVKFKLHEHFGGKPIFAAAFGFTVDGSAYTEFVEIGKKIFAQGEGVFLDSADAAAADEYKKVTKAIFPILEKVDATLTKQVLPAMSQSGLGIVIDGQWKSKQWMMLAPAMDKEMPMLELGLLIGVSDPKKFNAGMKELRTAVNELLEKWGEFPGGPPPTVRIPEPIAAEGLYSWEIPGSILDKQFMPTVGSGGAAGVLALSKAHAARLIKPTPLTYRAKELEISGEVLGCCVLDWVAFIDLVTPWVEHAMDQSAKDFGADAKKAKQWSKEAKTALMIFKAFKGSTCTTKKADVGTVSRTVVVIKDIEALPDPID